MTVFHSIANRLNLAMWCRLKGASKLSPSSDKTYSSVVVLCCEPSQNIPARIEQFYHSDQDGRRWKRLESCAFWVYIDLFSIFTNWD